MNGGGGGSDIFQRRESVYVCGEKEDEREREPYDTKTLFFVHGFFSRASSFFFFVSLFFFLFSLVT